MKKLIFSIYYDDANNPDRRMHNYVELLQNNHKEYANCIDAEYISVIPRDDFKEFCNELTLLGMYEDVYQALQHYKHKLIYDFSAIYDYILYIDLDIFIQNKKNIFDLIDENSETVYVHGFEDDLASNVQSLIKTGTLSYIPNKRSVSTKKALMNTLCKTLHRSNDQYPKYVINTGVILLNKKTIQKLNYMKNLKETKRLIDISKNSNLMEHYADYIIINYSYNNESIFSFLLHKYFIDIIFIGETWNYPYNHRNMNNPIPSHCNFIHLINKKFETVFNKESTC